MYCHFLLFLVDNDKVQFLKLFKRYNGLAPLPTPTNPAPKTTQEGDDQDAKNDEDIDMESPAYHHPPTQAAEQ